MTLAPEQYRSAVEKVLAVLNRFDLMGLEPGRPEGAPDDEYSPEAAALVQKMAEKGEVNFEEVSQLWLEQFSDNLGRLPSAIANDLVRTLNEELRQFISK
jgi:hypothetical protein